MLIGLVGLKRSGKDTSADFLLNHLGDCTEDPTGKAVKLAFADSLKRIVRDLYDLTEEQTDGPTEIKEQVIPRWGLSPREIMQRFGTQVGRSVHDETWIRYCIRKAQTFTSDGKVVIISDVRFLNEAEAIKNAGGWVIRVIREGVIDFSDMHESEVEQLSIPVHATMPNVGSLPDLERRIITLYQQFRELEAAR